MIYFPCKKISKKQLKKGKGESNDEKQGKQKEKTKNVRKCSSRNKGITLIALVITIVDACISDLNLGDKVVIYKKENNEINDKRS